MKPKVIAMFLPQYHRVPENDEWWGEGFTDWVAVRNAKSLYDGHEQPRVPLNNNYYDLLDKDTLLWQANLMKKYNIYGMCFYHYYFEYGRKILEKPAENLLRWKDVKMPFCFSWANETWARSWSKLQNKNVWSSEKEETLDCESDGVLLRQEYGREKDWEEHFLYLLPFFKDERYIKKDGKPIFLIYKAEDIPCLGKMIECWQKLATENGFLGLYTISVNSRMKSMDGILYQEPQCTGANYMARKYETENQAVQNIVSYEEICVLSRKRKLESGEYMCAFPGYDDTPRRGRSGVVYTENSPSVFEETLKKMIIKSNRSGSPYVFINAWNEWGEGMYLEPDEKNGYQYLEAVKSAVESYDLVGDMQEDKDDIDLELYERKVQQYKCYWKTLDRWMTVREKGGKALDYLKTKGYKTVAIYGLGMLGNHLLDEFKGEELCLLYGIDGKGDSIHMTFPIYTLDQDLPRVDAIIVTVVYEYDDIYQKLSKKVDCDIYSLDELLLF